MASRIKSSLIGKSTKVNKNLAKSIDLYSIQSFMLIIAEEYNSEILTKEFIQSREQLWMLLYPTLNTSLLVSSNDGSIMPEKNRIKLSTLTKFYQYEALRADNVIIKGSEKLIYGMKELSRTGVKSSNNIIYPIDYNSVKGHLSAARGLLWKDIFLFSHYRLPEGSVINITNLNNSSSTGVWIYEYQSREFLSYESSVKSCLSKYGVSSTHFKRIRKFGLEFKGKLFSNKKLH